MKMNFNIFTIGLIFISLLARSQNNITGYLQSVVENNTSIKAARQNLEAQTVGYKTNITPPNPEIEYGYFPGNSDLIGVKEIFGVNQSFEFPSVYLNKISLSKKQVAWSQQRFNAYKLETLMQAKLLWYELVFQNKLKKEYGKRALNAEKLFNAYQKSLDLGNISIIELNKTKIQYVKSQNSLRSNKEKISNILAYLIFYNGGTEIEFTDTSYYENSGEGLDTLINNKLNYLPHFLAIQEEVNIASQEVKLSKSHWLLNFNIGYESESVLNNKFSGVKTGISIPLWQNANLIKKSKLEFETHQFLLKNERNRIITETTNKFNLVITLKKNLDDLQKLIQESENERLLNKSLQLGEISIIEYFIELSYYYEVKDTFLELEKEYFQTLAELNILDLLMVN